MNAATLFGGVAVRKDMPGVLRAVTFLVVLLVAFSRIYLGVHSPQDIIIGAAAGLLVMWLTYKLIQWLEAHPEHFDKRRAEQFAAPNKMILEEGQ